MCGRSRAGFGSIVTSIRASAPTLCLKVIPGGIPSAPFASFCGWSSLKCSHFRPAGVACSFMRALETRAAGRWVDGLLDAVARSAKSVVEDRETSVGRRSLGAGRTGTRAVCPGWRWEPLSIRSTTGRRWSVCYCSDLRNPVAPSLRWWRLTSEPESPSQVPFLVHGWAPQRDPAQVSSSFRPRFPAAVRHQSQGLHAWHRGLTLDSRGGRFCSASGWRPGASQCTLPT